MKVQVKQLQLTMILIMVGLGTVDCGGEAYFVDGHGPSKHTEEPEVKEEPTVTLPAATVAPSSQPHQQPSPADKPHESPTDVPAGVPDTPDIKEDVPQTFQDDPPADLEDTPAEPAEPETPEASQPVAPVVEPDRPTEPEATEPEESPVACVGTEGAVPNIELITKSIRNYINSEVRYTISAQDCHGEPLDLRGLAVRAWYYPHYLTSLDRYGRRFPEKPYKIVDADSGELLLEGKFGLDYLGELRNPTKVPKYQWFTDKIDAADPVYTIEFSYNVLESPFRNEKQDYWNVKDSHRVVIHAQIGDLEPVPSEMHLQVANFNGWYSLY